MCYTLGKKSRRKSVVGWKLVDISDDGKFQSAFNCGYYPESRSMKEMSERLGYGNSYDEFGRTAVFTRMRDVMKFPFRGFIVKVRVTGDIRYAYQSGSGRTFLTGTHIEFLETPVKVYDRGYYDFSGTLINPVGEVRPHLHKWRCMQNS